MGTLKIDTTLYKFDVDTVHICTFFKSHALSITTCIGKGGLKTQKFRVEVLAKLIHLYLLLHTL